MADLGTLPTARIAALGAQKTGVWWATQGGVPGGQRGIPGASPAKHLPVAFGGAETLAYDCTGVVNGTALVGTAPVPGAEVWLFHRTSRMPVRRTITNANGEFTFTNLYKAASAYFAVAFDPDSGEAFNALIFDKLTPV